ncbi:hypothetical protein B0H10DRAFT_1774543 [Mycena sp. CBHHK59/15]|nr:hypothetical protein B0H10DRAFT_1774543 [Mycena sp. CBHHK59/15]
MVFVRTILNHLIITQWLELLPCETKESVSVLVDPADHQNVPCAYKLLKACISVGSLTSLDMSPTDRSTLHAFVLAGELWSSFLEPFRNSALLLSRQLSALSKFTYLEFTFYQMHETLFISNQLYFDFQALVKKHSFVSLSSRFWTQNKHSSCTNLGATVWTRYLQRFKWNHMIQISIPFSYLSASLLLQILCIFL